MATGKGTKFNDITQVSIASNQQKLFFNKTNLKGVEMTKLIFLKLLTLGLFSLLTTPSLANNFQQNSVNMEALGSAKQTGTVKPSSHFGTHTNTAAPGRGRECTLGEIILSAGSVANGVPANGQVLPIIQNKALFSLLGNTYGGDGRMNFQLPDLRGVAPNGLTYSICVQGIYPSRN